MSPLRPLALIERDATHPGGHWAATVTALAGAAHRADRPAIVIALDGMDPGVADRLASTAQVVTRPVGPGASVLLRLAHAVATLSTWSQAIVRHRRFPHQLTLLSRCLGEAAALLTAARVSADAVRVLTTASEGLPATTTLLGGPHVRIVHGINTTQDAPLRLLDMAAARLRPVPASVLCPTPGVHAAYTAQHPHQPAAVQPFAVLDAAGPLTHAERATARTARSLTPDDVAIALVGGWWPHKDIAVVDRAIPHLPAQAHLLLAGHPLDGQTVTRWRAVLGPRLHLADRALDADELRALYAAADVALVARKPGVSIESGLIADAVVYRVPLLVSDHDPDLTRQLTGIPGVQMFPAGDDTALTMAVRTIAAEPAPRPPREAGRRLGLLTAEEIVERLTALTAAGHPPSR